MTEPSGEHVRRPPRERFRGEEHLFDLAEAGEALEREPGDPRNGHRQITLFRRGEVTLVLFDFDEGGWLTDHSADGYVTVQVLTGEIQMTTESTEYAMPAGSLLVLDPGVRHDVRALQSSRMLLTVHLEGVAGKRSG